MSDFDNDGTIATMAGESGTERPSRFDEMIERTPWGRLQYNPPEATLVLLATAFLVGGLLLPPVWLLALIFTKKSKKEYPALQSVLDFIKLASFFYGFILSCCVYIAAVIIAAVSAHRHLFLFIQRYHEILKLNAMAGQAKVWS